MPDRLRKQIEWSVQDLRERAFVKYGVDINPNVTFSVQGMTAAYAVFDEQVLDFNLHLGLNNREVFETEIVGHEFVHLLADQLYDHQGHGKEWKSLMREFGYTPDATYNLDERGLIVRREKLYIYKCDCTTRYISREDHKNAKRRILVCPECQSIARCMNDRASQLQRLTPGTKAWEIAQLLVSYAELEVPPKDAILLLKDRLNVSYETAKTYYYKLRPAT